VRHIGGAIIPELVKAFTSTESRHVKEVVTQPKKAAHPRNFVRLRAATSPRTTSVWQWLFDVRWLFD